QRQILATYVSQYQTVSVPAARTTEDVRSWITLIPSIPSPSKALETAAYAVSLARLGTALNAEYMRQESLKLYTQALRSIQFALWDPKLMYDDETLCASVLLSIYELF